MPEKYTFKVAYTGRQFYTTFPAAIPKTWDSSLIDSLVEIAAEAFHIEKSLLFDKCRVSNVKFARWAIFSILKKRGYGKSEIGRIFKMDHSSVDHGLYRFPLDMDYVDGLKEKYSQIERKIEELQPCTQ